METLNNGMTSNEHLVALNTNLEYFNIALGLNVVPVTTSQDYIAVVNSQMQAIATICGVTHMPVSSGMKGLAARNLLNSQFALFLASAGFAANEKNMTIPFHFTTGISPQLVLDFIMTTTKTLKVDWGNGTSTILTGQPNSGAPDYIDYHKIATSTYTINGTYNVKITGYLKDVQKVYITNDYADINVEDFKVFTNLLILYSMGSMQYGSLEHLPTALTGLIIERGNVYGTDFLPATVTYVSFASINNDNVIFHVANLPPAMTSFNWIGRNSFSGSLNALPVTMEQFCVTENSNADMTYDPTPNYGKLTGNLSTLKDRYPNMYYFEGANLGDDITGSIQNMVSPMALWSLCNVGRAHVTGDLAHFPSTLKYCSMQDMDLPAGNIEDIPVSVELIYIAKVPNVIYNGGAIKAMTITRGITIDNNWSSAMVDAFLIACAAGLHSATAQIINMQFTGMGVRTSASNAAVATLVGKGFTVNTN